MRRSPAPADELPAPASLSPGPARDPPAPADERPGPADGPPAPADERPGPADGSPAPADGLPAPAEAPPAPAELVVRQEPDLHPHLMGEMEEVLDLLEPVEEPAPPELLAEPEVVGPFEPDPGRGLGDLPPPGPRRQLGHLPLQHLPHLGVDERLLDGTEPPKPLSPGETLEPREIGHQLVVEDHECLLEGIALLVGHQERPGHGGSISCSGELTDAARKHMVAPGVFL